jgi:3-phenylpropionate/trans-cinnamate dioxygenase ferredoxin reductase subunit
VLPANVSHYLQQQHERNGVRFIFGTTVTEFCGSGRFEFAQLSTGEKITADVAVVGVGVVPNSEIAGEAGVEISNGIVVDASGRTSDDSIYAAGDVANQPDGAGGRVRLESWANAQNQAIAAAKAMLGGGSLYQDVPYFWSDQYAIKLQILGHFGAYQDIVVRGQEDSQFISFYLNADRIAAVVGINRPQEIAVARRLMQKNVAVDRRRLVTAASLNEILRAAPAG